MIRRINDTNRIDTKMKVGPHVSKISPDPSLSSSLTSYSSGDSSLQDKPRTFIRFWPILRSSQNFPSTTFSTISNVTFKKLGWLISIILMKTTSYKILIKSHIELMSFPSKMQPIISIIEMITPIFLAFSIVSNNFSYSALVVYFYIMISIVASSSLSGRPDFTPMNRSGCTISILRVSGSAM